MGSTERDQFYRGGAGQLAVPSTGRGRRRLVPRILDPRCHVGPAQHGIRSTRRITETGQSSLHHAYAWTPELIALMVLYRAVAFSVVDVPVSLRDQGLHVPIDLDHNGPANSRPDIYFIRFIAQSLALPYRIARAAGVPVPLPF